MVTGHDKLKQPVSNKNAARDDAAAFLNSDFYAGKAGYFGASTMTICLPSKRGSLSTLEIGSVSALTR